jgi:hypothetical protein
MAPDRIETSDWDQVHELADSLAGFYVEERPDKALGAQWLERLVEHAAGDPNVLKEAGRLRAILEEQR